MGISLYFSYLKFIKWLAYVDWCCWVFKIRFWNFESFFPPSILSAPLSLFFFWNYHYACVGTPDPVPFVSEALFILLHCFSFSLFRLENLSSSWFVNSSDSSNLLLSFTSEFLILITLLFNFIIPTWFFCVYVCVVSYI